MNQKKTFNALELVIDLANQNALDIEEHSGDYGLQQEAKRQDKALELMTRFAFEMKNGNIPIAADVLKRIQGD
jgi:hypothetical protein